MVNKEKVREEKTKRGCLLFLQNELSLLEIT